MASVGTSTKTLRWKATSSSPLRRSTSWSGCFAGCEQCSVAERSPDMTDEVTQCHELTANRARGNRD